MTDDFLALPDDSDDDDDLLSLPAVKQSRPGQSKALKLPEKVGDDVPEGIEHWPYPLPGRDNVGRPRNIKTPERFDTLVAEYFYSCFERRQRPTMTGMQNHLGLTYRGMSDYAKRPEFSQSVSCARALVKESYEHNLIRSQGSVQGVIFALKNFGRIEGDFEDTNRTELTGANGQPIQTMNANLEVMTDIEKASRLLHILQKATRQGKDDEQ